MIIRKLAHTDIFSEKAADMIHKTTMEILEKNGIQILSDKARDIYAKNGAKVEGEQVYLTEELVLEQVKKAPESFKIYARNPENNVTVGGDNAVLAPGYGSPFVLDYENDERRRSTYEDYVKFTKLAGYFGNMDVVGGVTVEPNDIEEDLRHVKMMEAAIKYTDLCLMGSAFGTKKAKESIELAAIALGGMDYVKEHPVMITLINTNSPLEIDDRMSDALLVHAEYGQPMVVASLSMTGTTAPTTIAGALAQQNAEILAGITLAQLVNPGTPVVYGCASSVVDLKTGDLAIGSSKTANMFNGTAQMGRYYGLPTRGGGALTDALVPDAQSGYESMMNFMSAVRSGFNFILHSAGLLENYMTMSFEKYLIDEEICSMVKNYFAGIEVNEEQLAKEVILRVGSGGNYIAEEHTYNHMRDLKEPIVSSREGYRSDKEQPDTADRATKMYKKILEEYEAPPLDDEIVKEIDRYIASLKK